VIALALLLTLLQTGVYPRPDATFWSAQTGPVKLMTISGNSVVPFRVPATQLVITLADPSAVPLFRKLIHSRTVLSKATIDDAGDGEYYTLRQVVATGYSTLYGVKHPSITLSVGEFHMRCGPPTCSTPISD
jgi:hypothetical protein